METRKCRNGNEEMQKWKRGNAEINGNGKSKARLVSALSSKMATDSEVIDLTLDSDSDADSLASDGGSSTSEHGDGAASCFGGGSSDYGHGAVSDSDSDESVVTLDGGSGVADSDSDDGAVATEKK